jgi:DUF2934 family protein
MLTETLTADPEVQHQTGSETTPEQARPNREGSDVEGSSPDGGEIALLAYRYWEERGCPDGCPEEDWYRAERELTDSRASGVRG